MNNSVGIDPCRDCGVGNCGGSCSAGERRRAYAMVERELRELDVCELRLWRTQFWLVDGTPVQTTANVRGGPAEVGGMTLFDVVSKVRAGR